METTSLNASKALAFLSNFTSLFKPATLSVSANASMLNKAFSQGTRVRPQIGSSAATTRTVIDGYIIGQYAQGGVVIWVTDDRQHGLVVSLKNMNGQQYSTNQSTNAQAVNDYAPPHQYTNPSPKENYSGYKNLLAIQQESNWNNLYPVFYQASIYTVTIENTTYGDWFVPSLAEWRQIWNCVDFVNWNAQQFGGDLLNPFTSPSNNNYWCSDLVGGTGNVYEYAHGFAMYGKDLKPVPAPMPDVTALRSLLIGRFVRAF